MCDRFSKVKLKLGPSNLCFVIIHQISLTVDSSHSFSARITTVRYLFVSVSLNQELSTGEHTLESDVMSRSQVQATVDSSRHYIDIDYV